MKTIAIIDYGMGNLNSVEKAFELAISNLNLNDKILVKIVTDKDEIKNSDAIVLPGVGAFGAAMENLKKLDLISLIKDAALVQKKPFLGICLGYQLLFDKSYEEGEFKGLGIIKGEVKKFDEKIGLKIPHMGWNTVDFGEVSFLRKQESSGLDSCFRRNDKDYFYFVHSYYVDVNEKYFDGQGQIFWTEYGIKFAAGILKDNILGFQFHPEKSQENGIKLLENWCRKVYEK